MKTLKIGNHASYLYLKERPVKVAYSDEVARNIVFDYDIEGNVLGIEFIFEVKPEYYDDYKKRETSD